MLGKYYLSLSLFCPSLFPPPCLFFIRLCYRLSCTALPEWSSWNSICICLVSWSQISWLPIARCSRLSQDPLLLAPPSFPRFISYCSGTHTGTSPEFLSALLLLPRPPRRPFLALHPCRPPFLLHGSLPSLISNFTYCLYQFLWPHITEAATSLGGFLSLYLFPINVSVCSSRKDQGTLFHWVPTGPAMGVGTQDELWLAPLGLGPNPRQA